MASRKQSLELSSEAKLISYLESGATANNDEMMRRKHSMESSYSAPKDRHSGNKQVKKNYRNGLMPNDESENCKTLSEARSVGGTLPASTGRAASSTRLTHQEANTMAERDLGSTFLLPHVHLYKPDLTSDVSEFDSL
ncbi:hypothetical protein JYU34_019953 [Plutella xylostella]|uniref:Uncharacterized protein n=1 Tax=Plutella xylostella TaxID=51655 RepID=A0ABQ7PVM5_PLUXY|nr:hypothetical protein JYU34_019953 [Plutella xylostella]